MDKNDCITSIHYYGDGNFYINSIINKKSVVLQIKIIEGESEDESNISLFIKVLKLMFKYQKDALL